MKKLEMSEYKLTSEVSYEECYTGAVTNGCSGCMYSYPGSHNLEGTDVTADMPNVCTRCKKRRSEMTVFFCCEIDSLIRI